MGFVCEGFGLWPVRLGVRRGAPDGFDGRLEADRSSTAWKARGVCVGYRPRRHKERRSVRRSPIDGWVEKARSEGVDGIVVVALMTCRTKTATSVSGSIGHRGEGQATTLMRSRRIRDRVEERSWFTPAGACRWRFFPFPVLLARPGSSRASDRWRAFPFDGHWLRNPK